MFLILVNYKKPLEEVEGELENHKVFLDRYYSSGKLIFSGRRNPRTGGVILCSAGSREEAELIIRDDPFYQKGIADYEIIDFTPTKYAEEFKVFIR